MSFSPSYGKGTCMRRQALAVWTGSFDDGVGTMTTESGVLSNAEFLPRTRFAPGSGTDPDELIAASLGGCFSMALANELELSGFNAKRIETTATATLERLSTGWTMIRMQLDVHASVPNATQGDFVDAALAAKMNCRVARLLNTTISLNASLDS
jgi:lipoyl-dependent peroxiredoxin